MAECSITIVRRIGVRNEKKKKRMTVNPTEFDRLNGQCHGNYNFFLEEGGGGNKLS